MAFQCTFSYQNVGLGLVLITDTTIYPTTGSNQLSNFSDRFLTIVTSDSQPLPPLTSGGASRVKIDFPILNGTGDTILIQTGYSWDVALMSTMSLTAITPVVGSGYNYRSDFPTLAYCGQAYVTIQKQFFSALAPTYSPSVSGTSSTPTIFNLSPSNNNSLRYKDLLTKQSNQILIEIQNANVRASLGDMFGSQDAINNCQFIFQSAANNF